MTTLSKKVKTRKEHYCWGCCQVIPIKTVTERSVTFDSGTASTAYWCDACIDKLNSMEDWQREDGFAYGELAESP